MLEAIAYNEIADLCYKKLDIGDTVVLYGNIVNNNINIKEIEKWNK